MFEIGYRHLCFTADLASQDLQKPLQISYLIRYRTIYVKEAVHGRGWLIMVQMEIDY